LRSLRLSMDLFLALPIRSSSISTDPSSFSMVVYGESPL
jgi:hypothetical protein